MVKKQPLASSSDGLDDEDPDEIGVDSLRERCIELIASQWSTFSTVACTSLLCVVSTDEYAHLCRKRKSCLLAFAWKSLNALVFLVLQRSPTSRRQSRMSQLHSVYFILYSLPPARLNVLLKRSTEGFKRAAASDEKLAQRLQKEEEEALSRKRIASMFQAGVCDSVLLSNDIHHSSC